MPTATALPTQEVRADAVYDLATFRRLTGWGRRALRTARERGLKIKYAANRGYISGAEYHRYIETLAESEWTKGRKPAEGASGEAHHRRKRAFPT